MNRLVVVLPTKDRRELLERAVGSIRSQVGDWRAVIVDDGSSDGTQEYLAALVRTDQRFTFLRNKMNRGVNVSRNRALAELERGEWGFLLDDDDMLLPDALPQILERIGQLPPHIEYVFFNSHIRAVQGTFVGGYQFEDCDADHHDPSYFEVMTKTGLRGDCKPAIAASLVAKGYWFAEDVNGFESEFNALLARDGIGIRYCRDEVVLIDQAHGTERLSHTAAVRDPGAFVRVHMRMIRQHEDFLIRHPTLLRARAFAAAKIALRARDIRASLVFGRYWLGSLFRDEEQDEA